MIYEISVSHGGDYDIFVGRSTLKLEAVRTCLSASRRLHGATSQKVVIFMLCDEKCVMFLLCLPVIVLYRILTCFYGVSAFYRGCLLFYTIVGKIYVSTIEVLTVAKFGPSGCLLVSIGTVFNGLYSFTQCNLGGGAFEHVS
jgi:hypothetical protein